MSADNGIYILVTKGINTEYEYRVVHAQAIENLYWWPVDCCKHPRIIEEDETFPYEDYCTTCGSTAEFEKRDEINPDILKEYFGHSNVLTTEYAAMEEAKQLYDGIMDDDFCPIVEYGIQVIDQLKDTYFPV
ncbi:MAG TPA: hypothetical protein VLB82_11850 [Thermodesulfobacteriota bacterium]|nr:hypothetical protein [Thermodesulfobacteriota bacterium]